MTRNPNLLLPLALGLLLLVGCSPRTTVDTAPGVNFNQYRSFNILPPEVQTQQPRYNSQLILDRITLALSNQLLRTGLVRDGSNPDLLVAYNVYTVEREDVRSTPMNTGYWWGPWGGWGPWGPGGWGWGWYGGAPYWQNQVNTVRYTESTFIVDLVDARTRQLVWRGTIEGDVTSPDELERKIIRGLTELFEQYPDGMRMNGDGLGNRMPNGDAAGR